MIEYVNCICKIPIQEQINDQTKYLTEINTEMISAIDRYYTAQKEIILMGNLEYINNNPMIGELLLVGIISKTERYFREIITFMVEFCPICLESSVSQSVNIGSVLWSAKKHISRALFENLSFADINIIKKVSDNYIGHKINKESLFFTALESFEKVCQLRHCIVHSGSYWVPKNAINFGIQSSDKQQIVKIDFDNLQECISICNNLVIAANREFFEVICKRWAIDWRKRPDWDLSKSNILFDSIWNEFHSQIDKNNNELSVVLSKTKCKNSIKKHYNID